MTIAQTYPEGDGSKTQDLGEEIPVIRPFRISPATLNLYYYAILGISLSLSVATFVSSGSLYHALLYFFVSFMGTAFLGMAFLSFVIVPLCIKQHERAKEAQIAAIRAARIATIERTEQEKAERFHMMMASNALAGGESSPQGAAPEAAGFKAEKLKTGEESTKAATVEDQAASLRRMMAADKS
jgi:hypothetical protein